ncbi:MULTISPECIES: argininosuccinate synthase domain-containing protein [unclassified Amycolatopsis]|uniref:argininosuccinate synthase domain-containing protein n=1 Tax=unclassified Amycolatopsis TaxID=2618356 RepID=UPI001C694CC3|nr:argininosuccinate synthase domain-containing protein [Amycolatopsis sp. DSM 110486]QYN20708.1 argininosuccinate synthase [Amycolatopsis sp. DSM 110486]
MTTVLAYAGGPAGSVALAHLARETDVVTVSVDLGAADVDLTALRERALAAGAAESIVVDARAEFANEHCLPALQANALLYDRYPLVGSLARPLIEKHVTAIARAHNADVVWPREQRGKLCPDRTLWGRAVVVSDPDPWHGPGDVFAYTEDASANIDAPDEAVITFDRGVPVAVDGETVSVAEAVVRLGHRAGAHGVGRFDLTTDGCDLGREIYEAPGAWVLITAHQELENLTLDRDLARFKRSVDRRWTELVHDGLWSSPLREPLDAFVRHSQEHVCGDVRLVFHGGTAVVTGRRGEEPAGRGRHLRPVGRRYRPLTGQEHPDHPTHRAS